MDYSKIKIKAIEKGITIPQLAEKIGMSKAGLYLAIDKKRLTVDTLEKILKVLDLPIDSLFENDENTGKWTRQALIDELNKYDLTLGEYIQQSDELAERIGEKRHLLRMIYKDLKSIDAELNRLDHINRNEVSIKLRQMIDTIDKSEGFEGEEARLQKGKEERAKLREEIMKTRNERLNRNK